MIPGSLIGLEIDGHLVTCETNSQIDFERETLPSSSIISGGWKEYIEGIRGWSASLDANTVLDSVSGTDLKYVLTKFILGGTVGIKFRTYTGINPSLLITGNAIIRQGGISAPSGAFSTWRVMLQGTGPMNANIDPFSGLIINAMPPDAEYDLVVDTQNWEE